MIILKFRTDRDKAWQIEDAQKVWYDKINLDADYDGSASEYNKVKMQARDAVTSDSLSLIRSTMYHLADKRISESLSPLPVAGNIFFTTYQEPEYIAEINIVAIQKCPGDNRVYVFPYQSMAYEDAGGKKRNGIYCGNDAEIFILNSDGKTIQRI